MLLSFGFHETCVIFFSLLEIANNPHFLFHTLSYVSTGLQFFGRSEVRILYDFTAPVLIPGLKPQVINSRSPDNVTGLYHGCWDRHGYFWLTSISCSAGKNRYCLLAIAKKPARYKTKKNYNFSSISDSAGSFPPHSFPRSWKKVLVISYLYE